MGCASPRSATHASADVVKSATPSPQTLLVESRPRTVDVWEHHFGQALGIDAPFERIELLVSDSTPHPRLRLLLIRRPAGGGGPGARLELTEGELCFERSNGPPATFHVQAETPAGPLDWRFEWPAPTETAPEPAQPRRTLLMMIGLYAEPSKPIAVGPADR